jgi:outer membrane protein OmpA-like peptidoglycan-associated protein
MKLRHLLMGTAIALSVPGAALAQGSIEGPYFGAQIGVNWLQDSDFKSSTVTNKVSTKDALSSVIEGGYQFREGLRLGLEGGYTVHEVSGITGGPASRSGDAIGDMSAFTVMAVVQKEFDIGSPLRPYVGAGAGWGWLDTDAVGPLLASNNYNHGRTDSFAYQLNAGVAYAITDNLDLTVGYRYLAMDSLKFKNETPAFDAEYKSHSVLIGVRTVFGAAPAPAPVATTTVAPPPPPPPAPPPPPPPPPSITRNFTVFFDFDKSTLSPDAQQVLQNVARDAKAGKVVQVVVSGHADTSGPADYNQKLSQRRAEAVREYLATQGLTGNQIAVEAKGETDLLVPTADGVREPSNRRAVIIFP